MSHRSLVALAASAIFVLAACSSSAASKAPGGAASAAASSGAAGGEACKPSADAGAVAVTIIDFDFQPAAITAKTGQVITFTNSGAKPHTATLDAGACTTPSIGTGKSDGLVFSVAGTYPFHCAIHPTMKGTITVS